MARIKNAFLAVVAALLSVAKPALPHSAPPKPGAPDKAEPKSTPSPKHDAPSAPGHRANVPVTQRVQQAPKPAKPAKPAPRKPSRGVRKVFADFAEVIFGYLAGSGLVLGGLTLVEAAKLETGDVIRQAIIELYAGSSDILMNLPFDTIPGNAMKYNREDSLPGVGFRGVNEAYTPSTGVLNPLTEALVIAGGDLDVDKFIVDTMGASQRSTHEAMKVRALSLAWTKKFIKGDNQSDPREFDGLQVRITGNQKIAAGVTQGGDALSLAILDQAIDQTLNPTHLLMSKALRRRVTQAARNTAVGGYITYDKDAFGRRVTMYNDLPILVVDLDNTGTAILGFNEVSNGGNFAATAASIYVLSLGDGAIMGLQNGGVDVRDLGELQTAPVYRTRVEWYNGFAVYNGRAATRLWNISNAAFVA